MDHGNRGEIRKTENLEIRQNLVIQFDPASVVNYVGVENGKRERKGTEMRNYLENLIQEKGVELEAEIEVEGHIGLTYAMLIEFIVQPEMKPYHKGIRETLVKIDFMNGNVFHYLQHLAKGMVAAVGY